MTRRGALPAWLRAALRPSSARCYRHCDRPVHGHRVRSRLPGNFDVYACPGGVVSVTAYAEWSNRLPTTDVRAFLRSATIPASLVRHRDLRAATRHGPELGRAAERALEKARPRRPVRVVYWRVYPFRGRDGTKRRLFVCFRHGRSSAVFFAAPSDGPGWGCPVCAQKDRARPARRA